jgi:hypothetical protein
VRWLVDAAVAAVALTAIVVAMFPTFVASTGWAWTLVALLGFSVAAAGPVVLVQTGVQRNYRPAMKGLNLEQRTQIVTALQRGQIPSDPRVLAAAIQVGAISLAYRRHAARWQRTAKWWLPAAYTVGAVLEFIGDNTRAGLLWAGFGALFAAVFAWRSYRSPRLAQHVERLRGVAVEIPEAAAAAATAESVTLAPRRMRTAVLLAVVVGLGFGAATYLWATPRQTPDCRSADQVVNFIYANRDLLDASRITTGGPELNRYQDWSQQLRNDARQAISPDISGHLHRMAELSAQAVSLVQDIRKDPLVSPAPDAISDHETAYQQAISELITAEGQLVPLCHGH